MVLAVRLPSCPTEATVRAFVNGALAGSRLEAVERHVATCEACAQAVAASASGDQVFRSGASLHESALPYAQVGRYVLRRPVGAGAMGRVFVAHDPTLEREVALKVLHRDAEDPDLEVRLVREAKALGRLAPHPEVITVYDAGRDGDALYIAMELVEGGTLRQWAEEKRTWREVVAVFVRAGSGLAHAHAAGLVHRDFKPDNVLVGDDGRIRVTDFGLARPSFRAPGDHDAPASVRASAMDATLTRSGVLAGTPAYMAPEQFAGRPADARSDIFSFCVAFYEALYGERPFEAHNIVQLIERTTSGQVSPPPAGSDVPSRLRRVLLAGLRPEPEKRYASMTELLAAVHESTLPRKLPRAAGVLLILGVLAATAGALRWGHGQPAKTLEEDHADVHAEIDVPVAASPVRLQVAEEVTQAFTPPRAAEAATMGRDAAPLVRPSRAPAATEPPPSPAALPPQGSASIPAPRPSGSSVVIGANGAPILR